MKVFFSNLEDLTEASQPSYWEKYYTKQLLEFLQEINADMNHTINVQPAGYEELFEKLSFARVALYQVLATREHVPTKQEAKKLRQEKAKLQRNR